MELSPFVINALAWVIPVVIAITFHEAAHGFAAYRFGDHTAKNAGRMTLNPIKHVDPLGTLIIPAMLVLMKSPVVLGYAKPVPVVFHALRPLRLGMFTVAAAGPAINIVLAVISALLLHLDPNPWITLNLYRSILINCLLALFNMLPVLPLDGGRMLTAILPQKAARTYAKTEKAGMIIILALLFLPMLFGYPLFAETIGEATFWLMELIMRLTGNGDQLYVA